MMAWWRRRDRGTGDAHPGSADEQPTTDEEVAVPAGSWRPFGADLDDAQQALAEELAAEVTVVAEPENFDADGQVWPWTVELYDDVRALAGDAAIESLEDSLPGEVGVTAAAFEDREVLWVRGGIDPVQLHGWIVAYLARNAEADLGD